MIAQSRGICHWNQIFKRYFLRFETGGENLPSPVEIVTPNEEETTAKEFDKSKRSQTSLPEFQRWRTEIQLRALRNEAGKFFVEE